MRLFAHPVRSRHGIFYARLRLPGPADLNRLDLRRSLGTRDPRIAAMPTSRCLGARTVTGIVMHRPGTRIPMCPTLTTCTSTKRCRAVLTFGVP
jgi:hypothetical protein